MSWLIMMKVSRHQEELICLIFISFSVFSHIVSFIIYLFQSSHTHAFLFFCWRGWTLWSNNAGKTLCCHETRPTRRTLVHTEARTTHSHSHSHSHFCNTIDSFAMTWTARQRIAWYSSESRGIGTMPWKASGLPYYANHGTLGDSIYFISKKTNNLQHHYIMSSMPIYSVLRMKKYYKVYNYWIEYMNNQWRQSNYQSTIT